jgi:hypothetical protein
MGSAVALAAALSMTGIVFVLIRHDYMDRLDDEIVPLLKGLGWAWLLTALSVASFAGEVKIRPWRRWPQLLLMCAGGVLAWLYWPA